MKIWITRGTEFTISVNGLGGLRVWFQKPRFIQEHYSSDEQPFGGDERGGYRTIGWEVRDGKIQSSVNCGGLFGYGDRKNTEDDISKYIWDKLCEHFLNKPQQEWEALEKSGKVNMQDFILEIDINVSINKINNNESKNI